jgi:hypothetical protein
MQLFVMHLRFAPEGLLGMIRGRPLPYWTKQYLSLPVALGSLGTGGNTTPSDINIKYSNLPELCGT